LRFRSNPVLHLAVDGGLEAHGLDLRRGYRQAGVKED
jgi:hypothetical protein